MDNCPTCKRKFNSFQDFPFIYIASVSRIKPEEIPEIIEHWRNIFLTPKDVPREVKRYFRQNHKERKFLHTDGFIYEVFYDNYNKKINCSPIIKELITNNESLNDYFNALESIVGQEVEISKALPKLAKDSYSGMYRIPNTDIGFYMRLEESNKSNKHKSFSVILHSNAHLIRGSEWSLIQLLTIGHIEYDGLIKSKI